LWTIVNDAFQIHGGAAYFTDRPLERMLRDHRINQIGEGANEVLLSFIALMGLRGPGVSLKDVADAMKQPWRRPGILGGFVAKVIRDRFSVPLVPVQAAELKPAARRLARLVHRLGRTAQFTLIRHREEVVERQLVLERIAWLAMELFAAACALSRWDDELRRNDHTHDAAARLMVAQSLRRAEWCFQAMRDNDDSFVRAAARP
jgi:hypothetical protein